MFWVALRHLWSGWADALIIVKPETVVSRHRAGFRLFWRLRSSTRRPGRPKISAEIRELIRRMKADNPFWGAPRIHGELLQLGFEISEATVSRYLRQLKRRCDSAKAKRWLIFLSNHREVIAALDFADVDVSSAVLLFRHRTWPSQNPALSCDRASDQRLDRAATTRSIPAPCPSRYAILDRDAKFSPQVLEILRSSGIEPIRTSVRSPWQNGVAERWVGSCRREMLDHVIPLNEEHLKRLGREYLAYYHDDRTHAGLAKQTPTRRSIHLRPGTRSEVVALPRIGGLHHRYTWSEAA